MRTRVGERLDIPVELRLYEGVTNGGELRRRLAAREVDAAFLNADLVTDLFPVLVAAHQAVESARGGTLVAHSVHAQLLLCLSGGKSLSSALRHFGVGDATRRVLVVLLPAPPRGAPPAASTTPTPAPLADADGAAAAVDATAAAAAADGAADGASAPAPARPRPWRAPFADIAGVEAADVAAAVAAGGAAHAPRVAAVYKITAEELGGKGGGGRTMP
ncbi:hypothetical protein BU14_0056s0009 [Porphyra umbilicalis]|uniref:EKC/KEOPS complex subunit CGI121 n=1 Tax=Porphyra umbilicalis TaxID=2786 RepID=A0A1X6PHL4_PORUM|nr:hypothetical protein BU14_0056s0009 [Porphyra umbilicalis]|eukprot:OSX80226.1 hypothetical protein BU14_0056s0009 [Porphyra umbilicalis]